jgi:hypothetical protein
MGKREQGEKEREENGTDCEIRFLRRGLASHMYVLKGFGDILLT